MESSANDDLVKLEERFLSDLAAQPVPVESLLTALRYLRASHHAKLTESWAQMALGKLVDLGDGPGLVKVFSLLAMWRDDVKGFGALCKSTLKKASQDRVWNACVDSVAFGEVAPLESLRRLNFLISCKPGAICLDKTWGFGVVKLIDDFYKRMIVDFTSKPNHTLALANAAENLAFVPENHILAIRHRDPAGFTNMIKADPAEIVRMALRSFGAASVTRLANLLDEHKLVPTASWKPFWEGARKGLKADPLIEVPVKRTEPIIMREAALAFDRGWFTALRSERDIVAIVRQIAALEAAKDLDKLDDFAREVLSDRLAFSLKGAFNTDPARYTRLMLTVDRLKLATPPADEMCRHLLDNNRFLAAGESIPARESAGMVAFLLEHDAAAAAQLLAMIPEMNYNLVAVTLETMLAHADYLGFVQTRCRELLAAPAVPPTLLVWTLRNLPTVEGWPLPSLYELMGHAVAIIEDHTLSGELLRMQHQLCSLFEQAKWFEAAFTSLNPLQREAMFARIYGNSNIGDSTTQRALVGRMVKIDPALTERKLASNPAAPPAESNLRWTSWRSLRERQDQFRQLVEVEIPRNSADIAQARSYGDLSENFEYHAAKQQQSILMSRRDEWDLELKQMRGTHFADADTTTVGMGVEVTFVRENGTEQTYAILGEWDSDETLGILPVRSRLARVLDGRTVGDQVTIPGTAGDEVVTIRSIQPLRAAIRSWAGAPDAGTAALQ
jgi:transcription elongation factor GreA